MQSAVPRVLYVTQRDTVHDRRFLRAMRQAEVEAGVVRLSGAPAHHPLSPGVVDLSPRAESAGRPGRTLRLRSHLRAVCREFAPTVIHAGPIQQGAFLVGLAGLRPLISMSWGSDLLLGARSGVGRWKARWALSRSQLLLCDCQAVRKAALDLGASQERIVVFPWGVDLDHFRPGRQAPLRRQLGWGREFVLLSARSFEPIYGVDVLIEAFLHLAPAEPRLRLLLLGEGSMRPSLQRRIELAGLQSRVSFAGAVSEDLLPQYYRASDLYVSASHSDGSSVSLLEAMACGLASVVSDLPSNQEWVKPGVHGWLFPAGDSQALAEGIRQALVDPTRRASMGTAARARVENDADWRRGSRMLIDAYRMASGLEPV
jgi:glycosyltransferase involved in cell wall biosynthesis